MKKKNPTKPNLQQLIKEWDKKLKDSGFKDIENRKTGLLQHNGGDVIFDAFTFEDPVESHHLGYSSLTWKESQAEYYRLASSYVFEKQFKTDRHQRIWELHADGMSAQEIANTLKFQAYLFGGAFRMTWKKAHYAIHCMAIEFGLKCRK